MKTVETILPIGEIISMEKLPDGSWKVKQKVPEDDKATPKQASSIPKITIPEILMRRVEAESLSLDDEFMKYKPKTEQEEETKALIKEAIEKGVKNFYRPIMDPSFTKTGENIRYEKGRGPAVGKSYNWWKKVAEEYCPERNSRLGTRLEYAAFLGVLIKNLVAEGRSISWAWNAVCNDSKELGHYRNSENAKCKFEPTGSRQICDYYDLANTYKILAEDNEAGGFWLAGGCYFNYSDNNPLAGLNLDSCRDCDYHYSVGWLVLS